VELEQTASSNLTLIPQARDAPGGNERDRGRKRKRSRRRASRKTEPRKGQQQKGRGRMREMEEGQQVFEGTCAASLSLPPFLPKPPPERIDERREKEERKTAPHKTNHARTHFNLIASLLFPFLLLMGMFRVNRYHAQTKNKLPSTTSSRPGKERKMTGTGSRCKQMPSWSASLLLLLSQPVGALAHSLTRINRY